MVKAGRYGPYVTDGEVNATLPKSASAESLSLEEAVRLVTAKREAGGGKSSGRSARARRTATSDAAKPARKAAAKKATTAKKTTAKKPAAKGV